MPFGLDYRLGKVEIYDIPFDTTFNSPHGTVGRWMFRRGAVALGAAKAQVGVRTGALKAAISMEHDRRGPGRQQRIRIGTLQEGNTRRGYAVLHHEGTAPHVIRAKKGRMLYFTVRGRRHTAQMVFHPGTRANKYLTDTFAIFVG